MSTLAAGDVIITGPRGAGVWSITPPSVIVKVVPDGYELTERTKDPHIWAGMLCGFSKSDSKKYCNKPPTRRARSYIRWQRVERLVKVVGPVGLSPQTKQRASTITVSPHASVIAVDTETTGLKVWEGHELYGISIADGVSSAYVSPSEGIAWLETCDADEWWFHNAKFDLQFLEKGGFPVPRNRIHDTQIVAHLLGYEDLGLKPLARTLLHRDMVDMKALLDYYGGIHSIPTDMLANYAARDAEVTWELRELLWPQLSPEERYLYHAVERPLIPILADMEVRGIQMAGEDVFDILIQRAEGERDDILSQLRLADWPVDSIDSTAAVGKYLYDTLRLPISRRTKTGRPSADKKAIEELATIAPQVRVLLQYRQVRDVLVKFLYPLRPYAGKVLHPHIWQAKVYGDVGDVDDESGGTAQGRLSYSDPNFQQFSKRGGVRDLVTARPGYSIIAGDYGQIEMRIYADRSNDEVLIGTFIRDEDIHDKMRQVLNLPESERTTAKNVEYGWLYSAAAPKLAETCGRPVSEILEFMRLIERELPGAAGYKAQATRRARQLGYGETLLGRRRRLPDLYSPDASARGRAERQAFSVEIQGTAAEIIKLAMSGWVKAHPEAPILLQVHDELVIECPEGQEEYYCSELRRVMVSANILQRVPLIVDVDWGKTWKDAKS